MDGINNQHEGAVVIVTTASLPLNNQHEGAVVAAITTALYEVSEVNVHDRENTVLTIQKVSRCYSPWSSKIYGMREAPRK